MCGELGCGYLVCMCGGIGMWIYGLCVCVCDRDVDMDIWHICVGD